ncbi:hypothetical protein GGR58DRAFT_496837 [Xylaria digitata]|nr:hypothetical protein GGR58DRAFT_496837 [Xylaria digitata]
MSCFSPQKTSSSSSFRLTLITTRLRRSGVQFSQYTLSGIWKSGREEGGDFYLIPDYTSDDDLVSDLGLTQLKSLMRGCAECLNGFGSLENGLAHLNLVHFPANPQRATNTPAPSNDGTETKYVDVSGMYKRYTNELQLQVNRRPQKRLLPDIYALEEELDTLLRLNHWQQKFCHDFLRVLDPASYRITTKARISKFRTEAIISQRLYDA